MGAGFLLRCFLCISPRCRRAPGAVTPVSSPCRVLSFLGLALPLVGTIYVAATGWGSDRQVSPEPEEPPAAYGSLPLRVPVGSRPGSRDQPAGCAPVSPSGTPSGGKSRRVNKLTRGDLDDGAVRKQFLQDRGLVMPGSVQKLAGRVGLCSPPFGVCLLSVFRRRGHWRCHFLSWVQLPRCLWATESLDQNSNWVSL